MQQRELVKVKRGNALSQLWDEIFFAKVKKPERLIYHGGPVEQAINPDRQQKKFIMRARGMKNGKEYRRYLKNERIKERNRRPE
jgi:hypothetical protein